MIDILTFRPSSKQVIYFFSTDQPPPPIQVAQLSIFQLTHFKTPNVKVVTSTANNGEVFRFTVFVNIEFEGNLSESREIFELKNIIQNIPPFISNPYPGIYIEFYIVYFCIQ